MNDKPSALICQTEGLGIADCGLRIADWRLLLNDKFSSLLCAIGRWRGAARVSERLTDETAAHPVARGGVPASRGFVAQLQRSIRNPQSATAISRSLSTT